MDWSKECVYGCFGWLNNFLVVVIFINWFVYIIVIWLVIFVIIFKLWVIKIMLFFVFFCKFFNKLRICVWMVMFKVVVGLFVIKIGGLYVIVMVIIICWCMLLDNLWGYCFLICFGLGIFIWFNSLMVCVCFCCVVILVWYVRFFLIWFLICMSGFSVDNGFWKIILILFFLILLYNVLLNVVKFKLLYKIFLVILVWLGLCKFIIVVVKVFFL